MSSDNAVQARRRALRPTVVALVTVGVMLVLVALFGPQTRSPQSLDKASEAAVRSGHLVGFAMDEAFNRKEADDPPGAYPATFEALLAHDPQLAIDPEVTFVFGTVNASGYTFTTRHPAVDRPFVFRNMRRTGARDD